MKQQQEYIFIKKYAIINIWLNIFHNTTKNIVDNNIKLCYNINN